MYTYTNIRKVLNTGLYLLLLLPRQSVDGQKQPQEDRQSIEVEANNLFIARHRWRHLLGSMLILLLLLPPLRLSAQTSLPVPYLVADLMLRGNSSPNALVAFKDALYFEATGDTGHGLWKSDGTTRGTALIYAGVRNLHAMTPVNGTLFFTASDGQRGMELWKSDGTRAGTQLVRDIALGNLDSAPDQLTNINGILYFTADDGIHGAELWKSDGTPSGTLMLKEINLSASRIGSSARLFTNVNGTLYFVADDGLHGPELWKSNGTTAGTVLVKDIYPGVIGAMDDPDLANSNGLLYFAANDGVHGSELWKSDGTTGGTVLVKDIYPGVLGAMDDPDLANSNGLLYFAANDGVHGSELWKSDGTTPGTRLVKDINPGASRMDHAAPLFTNSNGTLYFIADDGVHGAELWKSSGSPSDTVMITAIQRNAGQSSRGYFQRLTDVNGTRYFVADDGLHGWELWTSDGTTPGTQLVKDIYPGLIGAMDDPDLVNAHGLLFFSANDGIHGDELWALPLNGLSGSLSMASADGDRDDIEFTLSDSALFQSATHTLFLPLVQR